MASKRKSLSGLNQNQPNIFGLLGFSDIPVEHKFQLVSGIGSWIHSEFLLRVVQSLTKEHIEELARMAEESDTDEDVLTRYLQSAVPNLNDLLHESVMATRANLSIQKNLMPTTV
ncbi:hypothetical protein HY732_03240 [Candidatus Uhrbacteria bacterium]|nr:hypothetical protein [Candidatus Uhrbacteria bacterium]